MQYTKSVVTNESIILISPMLVFLGKQKKTARKLELLQPLGSPEGAPDSRLQTGPILVVVAG